MVYQRVSKTSSRNSQIHKKDSSSTVPVMPVQAKSVSASPQEQEMPSYTPLAADWANNNNLMRSLSGTEIAQRQEELGKEEMEPIQAKLTIGQVGDKYEQEADQTAQRVVNQINAPAPQQSIQGQSLQGEEMPEEEKLQMKLASGIIQREEMPEEEELQMKSEVQRKSDSGGMVAKPDLEESIQQAKGGGQPLADNIRKPMEQAFGADFSGVNIHTDAQSDQLNQSIQAKAFTTGQDVFFRQGAYNPSSRGGQELIAHELTHVVQQSGGAVQRSPVVSHEIHRATMDGEDYIQEKSKKQNPEAIQTKSENPINDISQTVIQRVWQLAEVTKTGGAALHKVERDREGEATKVRKGGMFGGGKVVTAPQGGLLWVDPEKSLKSYVLGRYPLRQGQSGYINTANYQIAQWWKDAQYARNLLDGYLETHKVQQHIEDEAEFQDSTRVGMGGLFAAINRGKKEGFFANGKVKDPMEDVNHWKNMGKNLREREYEEEGKIPMTCDQSTAIIISTLADDPKFKSSLTVIKQGDPKQHGHWYVLANRGPDDNMPQFGEALKPGEFIIDIWGSLRLQEQDPNVNTVVHAGNRGNAIFNASVITEDQQAKGEAYVKKKIEEQNKLKKMVYVPEKE